MISQNPNDVLESYKTANLVPLLESIRKPGRYAGLNGVNALTNAALGGSYDKDEVTRELRLAVDAGQSKDCTFVPAFTNPKQGLAYGLNPYTDWALAQIDSRPTHYYLFLGLDWYAISGLGNTENWFDYLCNPFLDRADRYWHNVWAWVLRRIKKTATGKLSWQTPITNEDAAAFIRADGGAFVFHNRIPYLRPAGYGSADNEWHETEWRKKSVRHDVTEDLCVLRLQADNRIVAICTGQDSVDALVAAGYEAQNIMCWKAHPSRVFHPSQFIKRDFWFRGLDYFHS